MREGHTRKYLLWLAMLTILLSMPVAAFVLFGSAIAGQFQYIPLFGMELSSGVLMLAVLVSVSVANQDTKIFKWDIVMFICGLMGFSLALYLTVFTDIDSFLFIVYIPGAPIVLNAYLILLGAATVLNTGFIFLVQTWAAGRDLGLPLWQVMPVHLLFALWMLVSLIYLGDTVFIIFFAFLVLVATVLMLLIEMLIDWRRENKLKSLGKIYT